MRLNGLRYSGVAQSVVLFGPGAAVVSLQPLSRVLKSLSVIAAQRAVGKE